MILTGTGLKKLYLTQVEEWESKIFIALFTLTLSSFISWLIYLYRQSPLKELTGWITLILAVFLMVSESYIQSWRKKSFNRLIEEIKTNNLGEKIK
jgi:hypothetical protein